ncbi:M48 family metallopeptidase [Horticoccus luteus]|uniref:M48 family metallopeptidase n=1 Tax=Horticoccus luteus TaxID=2862869 RepID=UPI0021084F0E|nr:SprT family zinc-dependent metalloprotease [Horticoccus luteus]
MNEDRQQDFWSFFAAPAPLASGPRAAAERAFAEPVGAAPATETVSRGGVVYERSATAQRYRLTLRRDGVAVAVIPRRGSQREAEQFVAQQAAWLERARARQARRPRAAEVWTVGTRVLWRGELEEIRVAATGARPQVCLAADVFRVARIEGDLRATLEAQFARRAKIELPARTWELAAVTGVDVKHVTVRNQRSRWGSCSSGGTISLNWRLVQTPDFVRDYIVFHELMHLREMNHSARFWARVEEVCPAWREAEHWLKRNGSLVGL